MSILQDYSSDIGFDYTIILPIYNRITYLDQWVRSVAEQEHQGSTEILIMDDCSDRLNRADIEAIFVPYQDVLEQKKYRIHYYRNRQNLKEYGNTNFGIQLSNGHWVYIVHDDDLLLQNTLLEFEAVIREYPETEVITGRFFNIDKDTKILEKSPELNPEGLVNQRFLDLFLYGNPIHPVTTIYTKTVFEKVGYLDTSLTHAGDWDFLRRLATNNVSWYYIPRYLCAYRLHDAQLSRDRWDSISGEYIWHILNKGKRLYSATEFRNSCLNRYHQIFKMVDFHLNNKTFAQGISLLLDMIHYSDIGDRLWFEALNHNQYTNKTQIHELILMLQEKLTKQ